MNRETAYLASPIRHNFVDGAMLYLTDEIKKKKKST